MAYEFKLPDLGEGITSGEIKRWAVKTGDHVDEDDPIAEVETDKAVVELPSPVTGTIEDLRFKEGEKVPVGAVLAAIRPEGEAAKTPPPQEKAVEKATTEARKPPASPAEATVAVPALATPATRLLAKNLGVDLDKVKGSGPGGRITDDDVRASAGKPAERPAGVPPAAVAQPASGQPEERIPLRGIRRTISDNLLRSLARSAQVTLCDDADVTRLGLFRDQVNQKLQGRGKVSYLALAVKAVVTALADHPYLNSTVDDERGEIVLKRYYHVGIAIDSPRGLVVAPVKDADRKSILAISKEIAVLVEQATTGKIGVEQLRGSTFTIANVGSIGGLWSTPIINPPEVAILELQQIRAIPRVCDGQVCVRKVLNLCLTIDHRIIDGAEGQRFLNDVKRYLEDPDLLLVSVV